MSLYGRIRSVIKAKGFTVNKAEQLMGISRGSIQKFDEHEPGISKIMQIADFLGVSIDDLIYEEPPIYLPLELVKKAYLPKTKLVLSQLIEIMGVSPENRLLWSNHRYWPSREEIDRLADALGISIETIKEDVERYNGNFNIALRDGEKELLKIFNNVNKEGKTQILEYADYIKGKPEYAEKNNRCEISAEEVG